jgi:hypothetical protein
LLQSSCARLETGSGLQARGAFRVESPRGYKRSSDNLGEQICDRLESHGGVNASEIEVQVQEDEVTLSGRVASREQKRLAEQCAESVRGIRDVHNHLSVDSSLEDEGYASGSGASSAMGPGDQTSRSPRRTGTSSSTTDTGQTGS